MRYKHVMTSEELAEAMGVGIESFKKNRTRYEKKIKKQTDFIKLGKGRNTEYHFPEDAIFEQKASYFFSDKLDYSPRYPISTKRYLKCLKSHNSKLELADWEVAQEMGDHKSNIAIARQELVANHYILETDSDRVYFYKPIGSPNWIESTKEGTWNPFWSLHDQYLKNVLNMQIMYDGEGKLIIDEYKAKEARKKKAREYAISQLGFEVKAIKIRVPTFKLEPVLAALSFPQKTTRKQEVGERREKLDYDSRVDSSKDYAEARDGWVAANDYFPQKT